MIRTAIACLVAGICAGCGTFQLASAVYPPAGKTQQDQQLDNLTCKDRAKLEANTAGRQAGAFALGFTIVGAPVAYELEKSKQREVYADCMTAKGYRVVPADDGSSYRTPTGVARDLKQNEPPKPAVSVVPKPAVPVAPVAAASAPAPTKDVAAQLEKLNELRAKGLISEEEYVLKRKAILDTL